VPRIFSKIITFLKESKIELSKVVWLSRAELIRHTWVVIVFSVGVSLFLGLVDYLLLVALKQVF